MRIIARRRLREFWGAHPDAEEPLRAWHSEAERADWGEPRDIKSRYSSASFLGNNRVVFNIAGNKYRLIVAIKYELRIIYIRFVGTHGEYDDVDAEEL